MPYYNDQKLDKFYSAINHYADAQRQKIISELDAYEQEQVDRSENELLSEAYRIIQKGLVNLRVEIRKQISSEEQRLRKELLESRSQIQDKVFQSASQKLLDYTQSDAYPALLEQLAQTLSAVLGEGSITLRLCPRDQSYESQIKKAFGRPCTVELDDTIRIGGLIGRNSERGVAADQTLDAMLEAQHGWFEENSHLEVV